MPVDPLADDEPQLPSPSVSVLRRLAEQGLTDSEIAARVGMDVDAVRASPDVQVEPGPVHDLRAARALYERAVGSETWAESFDKLGRKGKLYARVIPDVAAAKAWLAARKGGEWSGDAAPTARIYVVQLPAPASDAASWLAGSRRVIDHDLGGGSEPQGGSGTESSAGTNPVSPSQNFPKK